MFINPYNNIDFENCIKVSSFTHSHCPGPLQQSYHQYEQTSDEFLERLYNWGYRFLPISNYHPSVPAKYSDYSNVPNDVIISPNAEQYQFLVNGVMRQAMHINGVGSLFDENTQPSYGISQPWKQVFKRMLNRLKYSDAGGITINHPHWSADRWDGYNLSFMCEMLDFDQRVLGIEVYNTSSERGWNNGYDIELWDNILKTGRRCWGFVVPDWDVAERGNNGYGQCVLLLDSFNEYNSLKAIREGAFYGKRKRFADSSLAFTNISINGNTLNVKTEGALRLKVIQDGIFTEYKSSDYDISDIDIMITASTYVRIEAYNYYLENNEDSDYVDIPGTTAFAIRDKIYSNPIMINAKNYHKNKNMDMMFLFD